ncbi:outer membrane protein [Tabrizicola aquatica]|uniref:outer membrane protein n=1 Tax=Tabrizicola aquatica TaxID=909926 RepID=UPI000CD215DB|nr:outer membrane beta-barrel protein [Tabrizicola aquatica]
MKSAAAVSLALSLSSPAYAGGPTLVGDEPAPSATPAPASHDWSGAYVGLTLGSVSGDLTTSPIPGVYDVTSGTYTALHAGYLFQRGRAVFGAELSYGTADSAGIEGVATSEFQKILDLKARIGFATNNMLIYGLVGRSKVFLYDNPTNTFDMQGTSYGLGAELVLSERLTVGAEYVTRDVSGTASSLSFLKADTTFDTLSLRASLTF